MFELANAKSIQLDTQIKPPLIQPLSRWQTGLAFGLPTLMMILSFHWFMPWLLSIGLTDFESIIVVHTVPMALLLTAVPVIYHQVDGYPLTWPAFRQRLRYPRLTLKSGLLGVGLFLAAAIAYGLFSTFSLMLIKQGWLPLTENIPALLDPRVTMTTAVWNDQVGGQILGNWGIIILYAVMLGFNIVGEELWWRGYVLPRQEAGHGRFVWVGHGLLWTVFHLFKWWDLVGLLPVCLLIAYVSYRTKNNWPAFIAHLLFNGLGLLALIQAVFTVIS